MLEDLVTLYVTHLDLTNMILKTVQKWMSISLIFEWNGLFKTSHGSTVDMVTSYGLDNQGVGIRVQ
jgi:hypothetical protein